MSAIDVKKFLTCLPFFAQLDEQAAATLSTEMERRSLKAGTVLFTQGDPGDAVYIIVSGKFRVSMHPVEGQEILINELNAGECIGELALLSGQPRTATVMALEDSELLCLGKSAFERLSEMYPNMVSGLAARLLPRFQQVYIDRALTHLFGSLDSSLRDEILQKLHWQHLESGRVLFQQGQAGNEMYIVVRGRLRYFQVDSDGTQHFLGEVGAGESIGEFALLAEKDSPEAQRTATVQAARTTDLIGINREVFEDLLCQHPQAILNLTRQIVRRSTMTGRATPAWEHNLVITLIPVQAGQQLEEFARPLAESLSTLGATWSLNAGSFEESYGKPGASATPLDHPLSLVINAWLDEREGEHRFTVYDASPALDEAGKFSAWAQRCLEDADLLLLVGKDGQTANPGAVEQALSSAHTRARIELVLLHPYDCQLPSATSAWLKPRAAGESPVQAHHHVRLGKPADFRRLARRISGKPVGLVFSGGGARGLAHLGVLRAFEEANLEFDWVAGSSMGAIVGAGSALDWSSDHFSELASRFSDPKKLLDYTFPYASFTSTRHITNLLRSLFGSHDIEDTWRPFFCISSNLSEGKERVHASGPLWKAVRASMAFPGIFAPVSDEGCVLIDGSAANNLPLDRMRERCPTGTVIGVELVTGSPIRGEYDFSPSLSGWEALFNRFTPAARRKRIPTVLNIIDGLVYGNNRYRFNETRHCADLLIRVPVQDFGLLEFDRYEEIIEAGYQAAREQIKGLK